MYLLIYGISSRARKNNPEEQVKVILMFLLNVQAPGIGTRNHHIFSLNEINREKFLKKKKKDYRCITICKGLYQTVVSILFLCQCIYAMSLMKAYFCIFVKIRFKSYYCLDKDIPKRFQEIV